MLIRTFHVRIRFDATSEAQTLRVLQTELDAVTRVLNFNALPYEVNLILDVPQAPVDPPERVKLRP